MRRMSALCLFSGLVLMGTLGAQCVGDIYGGTGASAFVTTLSGAAERPDPVTTDASGTGTFTLSADETELTFDITVSGLSGDVIGAHFHVSLIGAEGFGGIVFPITDTVVNDGEGGATAEGTWNLTEEDLRNVRLGYIYVNFHTELNPGGEIRGNLSAGP